MTDQSFSRCFRLINAHDYSHVFSKADQKVSDPFFLILTRPNGLLVPRLGLVIAKKHVKKSVDRNKIKRVVRESFRKEKMKLLSLDCVVLARPKVNKISALQIKKVIESLFYQLSLKSNPSHLKKK